MMRLLFCVPLLALGLTACSDEPEVPEEVKPMVDVEAEAQKLAKRTPGLYRTTTEVIETSMEGLGPQDADRVEGAAKTGSETAEQCLTQKEADDGIKDLLLALAQPDVQAQCDFTRFTVNGIDLDAKLSCKGPLGTGGQVSMTGQIEAERLDLALETKIDASVMGQIDVKFKITSERIGDCPADGAAK